MKNTKKNLSTKDVVLGYMIPSYRYETMSMYAAIVKAVGEQSHIIQEAKFYWTLSIAGCDLVDIEIILTERKGKPVLEIFEIVKEENLAYKKVDYDVVYTLLGYAYANQIEMTYN